MTKRKQRLLPALLALVMILSLLPAAVPAAQAASGTTGSISATVRIDYDQSLKELQERAIQAELRQGSQLLGTIDLTAAGRQSLSGNYTAQVSHRDQSGGALYSEWPGYLDFTVDGLPQGAYTLRFTGRGYVPYEETVYMTDYSRHLIIGTGDATFTLGDVNSDGKVNEKDLEQLSAALGSELRQDLNSYDLNGDGVINIIDLAYVNRMLKATGGSESLETVLLAPPVDTAALTAQLAQQGVTVTAGNLSDLFVENGRTVTFAANSEGLIVLPLEFSQATELEELRIVSPESAAPLAGTVEVEDAYGNVTRYSFDNTVPAGIQVLSAQGEGSSVISIDLGKRIAVKKVTITVTKTAAGYATVESIQFLKEMIPADPDAAASQVTGLAAVEGDGKVSLTWNSLPNISGYRVTWWPVNDPSKTQQKMVEVNRLEVSGLENMITYEFTVTAVDGDWSGKPSAAVSATPQPAKAPDAPDMVSVAALDGSLGVSWKASKNATYYEVYYTDVENASPSSYTRWGEALTATRTTITGLTNDTAYYIYIIAGNEIGRSGPSRISTGTPKATVYARPEGIPTEGVLDYRDFQDIRLAAPNNYSTAECPNFSPWHMADGDYRTQWTVANWWGNEHVIVTFKEPQDLSAAIWVTRMDGTYSSNLRAYSVLVWYEGEDLSGPGHHITPGTDNNGSTDGGDVHTWPAVRGNPSATKFAIMPFNAQKNVIQISVAAEQSAYNQTNLSELMFLKYDENHRLPDDIAELFADGLRTALASTTTQAEIELLRTRLSNERDYYLETDALEDELDLAQELLNGQTGSSVLLNGIESRSGSRDSTNYGQSGSALQPLGAAAAANTEITIYAQGIPEGETVTVYATQFNAEASAWQASMGTLENGRNVLTVPKIGSQNTPRGGSLYISYSGTNAANIRLHVRRGTPIPVLNLSGWDTMGSTARTQAIDSYLTALDSYIAKTSIGSDTTDWRNVTEIATPSVLLSLPAKAVYSGLKGDRAAQLTNSVEAWEELLQICRTVQGITGTMETRQNIRCMQMFAGAFMYAAGNHVGIGYGSCSGMTGGAPVRNLASDAKSNSLFGWGIAHEIGHNMDKLGKAEITNNIYSLAVQTYDGKQNTLTSRLEASGKYAAIFNKAAQGYPGASNDVFVQLGMYWQLHLAYDGGTAPLDFYTRFFTAWKAGTHFNGASSYDDRVALTASAVAGKDLTEFFTRWGMTLSEETKAKLSTYGEETRAIWYLNDQSRRDRLAGVSAAEGTVTASAVKQGDNEVVLAFGATLTNSGKVQGYEIRRNGVPIAFTTGATYTDTIGTSNNRTYEYTVTAYDTLGGKIDEAKTNEVRIAYDLLLDSGSYTMTKDGGTVRVTFPMATAVTGLKLPAGVDTSDLKISITENGQPTDAKNTPDAGRTDSTVTYFQRPNADESQSTQVWTYQATAITITGLPAEIKTEDVQLISYMGDDIAFLDGPTIGVMAHDYRYGDGEDDVIKEGTLVVTGTYRGDPTYNTVRIKGDFSAPDMSEANQDQDPETPAEDIRDINGLSILFAAESSDQTYTNISDGIFIFVPDVQREAELTGDSTSCGAASVLPSRIRAELWRTIEPDSTEGTRCTAQTLWISSPGGTDLPLVEVKGEG